MPRPDRPLRRFYVTPETLDTDPIVFGPREAHHIATVLRLSAGTPVAVFDGSREAEAELTAVDQARVSARLIGAPRASRRPVDVALLQGVARAPRMDLVVRMGTEVGLAAIHPVLTARSLSAPLPARLARWRRIATEAARQCGRGDVPEIPPPAGLEATLHALGPQDLFLVLWEGAVRPIGEVIAGTSFATAAVLVGPEGGLTEEEVATAHAAGGRVVSLGPLILRTETAGLVAAAMVLYERLLRPRG
ncbi:MAG: RsmE family RNA methyltransferase [Armatimonadota bacterium]|nr:RsmE family RNA methyltransferase [Armatimonadota bacterium]